MASNDVTTFDTSKITGWMLASHQHLELINCRVEIWLLDLAKELKKNPRFTYAELLPPRKHTVRSLATVVINEQPDNFFFEDDFDEHKNEVIGWMEKFASGYQEGQKTILKAEEIEPLKRAFETNMNMYNYRKIAELEKEVEQFPPMPVPSYPYFGKTIADLYAFRLSSYPEIANDSVWKDLLVERMQEQFRPDTALKTYSSYHQAMKHLIECLEVYCELLKKVKEQESLQSDESSSEVSDNERDYVEPAFTEGKFEYENSSANDEIEKNVEDVSPWTAPEDVFYAMTQLDLYRSIKDNYPEIVEDEKNNNNWELLTEFENYLYANIFCGSPSRLLQSKEEIEETRKHLENEIRLYWNLIEILVGAEEKSDKKCVELLFESYVDNKTEEIIGSSQILTVLSFVGKWKTASLNFAMFQIGLLPADNSIRVNTLGDPKDEQIWKIEDTLYSADRSEVTLSCMEGFVRIKMSLNQGILQIKGYNSQKEAVVTETYERA